MALTLAPRLFSSVTFKPLEDFTPVGMVGSAPNVVLPARRCRSRRWPT